MGTIICQDCNDIIEVYENEKASVLYGKCHCCHSDYTGSEKKKD